MNTSTEISFHSLNEKQLDKIAFDIFREWINQVKLINSSIEIIIIDERNILRDVKTAILKSLNTLFKSEKFHKKFLLGWDIGFILGFVSSSLNINWCNEYIMKQSNDYKVFMSLKAIRDYLKFDKATNIKIDKIFQEFISSDHNLQNYDFSIQLEDFNYQGEVIKSDEYSKDETIIIALENAINTQLSKTLNILEINNFRFEIDNFLTHDIIKTLIEENLFLANKIYNSKIQ